jgi:hypothetical protein
MSDYLYIMLIGLFLSEDTFLNVLNFSKLKPNSAQSTITQPEIKYLSGGVMEPVFGWVRVGWEPPCQPQNVQLPFCQKKIVI